MAPEKPHKMTTPLIPLLGGSHPLPHPMTKATCRSCGVKWDLTGQPASNFIEMVLCLECIVAGAVWAGKRARREVTDGGV